MVAAFSMSVVAEPGSASSDMRGAAMSSQSRPSYYMLIATDGHQAILCVPPDDDPWQTATQ